MIFLPRKKRKEDDHVLDIKLYVFLALTTERKMDSFFCTAHSNCTICDSNKQFEYLNIFEKTNVQCDFSLLFFLLFTQLNDKSKGQIEKK